MPFASSGVDVAECSKLSGIFRAKRNRLALEDLLMELGFWAAVAAIIAPADDDMMLTLNDDPGRPAPS